MTLPVRGFAAAVKHPRWWDAANLRALAGVTGALGYACGPKKDAPEWAFLAADITTAPFQAARRSVVVLKTGPEHSAVVSFDFATPGGPCTRQVIEGAGAVHHTVLLPGAGDPMIETEGETLVARPRQSRPDAMFLNVTQFGPPLPVELIWTIDLAGIRMGDRVVLFHPGSHVAHQPVFFDVDEGELLKCLVTGLAPGFWDLWWRGWLEQPDLQVAPGEGVLYFESPKGGYYLRRRNGA
ncbi:MAG TPA: hypothetical protein VN442_19775 [Bryobacteraceae bacterium]|nr:hypothetical protein [Bryobacteraceae bacterium]